MGSGLNAQIPISMKSERRIKIRRRDKRNGLIDFCSPVVLRFLKGLETLPAIVKSQQAGVRFD